MKKRAFSLIELLISLAIISLLLLVIGGMFHVNFLADRALFAAREGYQEANKAMEYVENNVREAKKINIDNSYNACECNFHLLVDNRNGTTSKRKFYTKEGKLYLLASNMDNATSKETSVPISTCSYFKAFYDEESQTVEIEIRSKDGETYKTFIDLGER